MEVHMPRPLHGWREFFGEVGIIVLGVLVALAAEQVASSIHDRDVARQTRADVTDEINDDLASIALRQKAEPCIDRRFRELRSLFRVWQEAGSFPTPSWVAQTPVIDVATARYNAEVSAGHMALLPGEEQFRMGVITEGIARFDRIQQSERQAWGRLRALQMGAKSLGPNDRAMLLTALQDASTLDYEAKLESRQILALARTYRFAPDYERVDAIAGQVWTTGKFTPTICTAIDTPPDQANRTQIVPLPL